MEEADHMSTVAPLFEPFCHDAKYRAVDEDHIVGLCHSYNLAHAARCQTKVIAQGHVHDALQVFPHCATVGFIVDEVGVYVCLTGNLTQDDEVFLTSLFAAFGHAESFLISDDEDLHFFFLR